MLTREPFMNITKISLCSFIFMTHFIQAHTTEEIKKSIENKLANLDATIVALAAKVKLAEHQKNDDQKEYESYMQEATQSWWPRQDYSAPQIKNYKGNYQSFSYNLGTSIYDNTGSEGKYNALEQMLYATEHHYPIFKENFERSKRFNDVTCLQRLEKKMQNFEDKVQKGLDQLTTTK
jgi:hypothetical protein